MLMGDNKSATTKNAGKLLAILIAMQMPWCDAGHIARWSTSRASLDATGCRHGASAHIALPRRLPRLTILVKNTFINKKLFLAS